jgi:hypothetical protein
MNSASGEKMGTSTSWEPENANGSITSPIAESPAKQRQQQAANVIRNASNSNSRDTNNRRSQETSPVRIPKILPLLKIKLRRKMYVR